MVFDFLFFVICFIFNGFLFFVNDFVGIILVSKSMRMVELESYSLEFPHGCIVGKKARKGATKLLPFKFQRKTGGFYQ